MLEATGDLFTIGCNNSAICITTNGIVKSNGCAVMGAGLALKADQLFNFSAQLGKYITKYGNRCFNMGSYMNGSNKVSIVTFPTKHHFKEMSDINLISKSAEELVPMADKFGWEKIYLPPVGCGLGGLNYKTTVKPWLELILDDRFIVLTEMR